MKEQLRTKIKEILDEEFSGHPSREDEHDIRQLKEAILEIAAFIDRYL
ncbi:MAG TPA: hypothetical protein VMW32_05840 [Bacteroidales bacterium]|nr:hypothetical protein [Bacteroidales bacterium]